MNLPAPSLSYVLSNRLPVKALLVWLLYVAALLLWYWLKFGFQKSGQFTKLVGGDWLAAMIGGLYFSFQTIPLLGDSTYLIQIWQKNLKIIWASEPLSHWLLTDTFSPYFLSEFLPPVMGAVSMWLWLKLPLTGRESNQPPTSNQQSLTVLFRILFFVSSPMQMIFYRGYFETLMIFIPFGLFYIYLLLKFANRPEDVSLVLLSALALGLAISVHGVAFVWLPIIPIWLLFRRRFRLSLLTFVLPISVYGFWLVILSVVGYRIDWLNAGGGGDNAAFVSIYGLTDWADYSLYWFGSIKHIWAVLSILVYSGLFLMLLGIFYFFNDRGRPRLDLNIDVVVRFLLFGAFLGFIVFWNFDLGFFYDFDLIFSLSLSAGLLAEVLIQKQQSKQIAVLVGVAIAQTGLWMTAFSRFF